MIAWVRPSCELMTAPTRDDPLAALGSGEREVLALLIQGRTDLGIAGLLFVTPKSVEPHACSIFSKLDLPSEENCGVHVVLRSFDDVCLVSVDRPSQGRGLAKSGGLATSGIAFGIRVGVAMHDFPIAVLASADCGDTQLVCLRLRTANRHRGVLDPDDVGEVAAGACGKDLVLVAPVRELRPQPIEQLAQLIPSASASHSAE